MMSNSSPRIIGNAPCAANSAFSLVEVVLAVGIVAFGIIAIFTLLPTALVSVRDGKSEEAASDILALTAADLRQAPRTGDPFPLPSPLFQLDPYGPSTVPLSIFLDAAGVEVPADQAVFRLVVTPRSNVNPDVAVWHVVVDWPPQSANPADRVESLVVLRR